MFEFSLKHELIQILKIVCTGGTHSKSKPELFIYTNKQWLNKKKSS